MKRTVISVSLCVLAFAITGLIAYSKRPYVEPYVAAKGWTITQNVIQDVNGQPTVVEHRTVYYSPDGRRKSHHSFFPEDEAKRREIILGSFPNLGTFEEVSKSQTLRMMDSDYSGFIAGDVNPDLIRSSESYIRDETILGFKCAVRKMNNMDDGSTIEVYEAYNLGAEPIKIITSGPNGTRIEEPISIQVGPISEENMAFQTNWPVDFRVMENRIKTNEETAKTDPLLQDEVNKDKEKLDELKKKFAKGIAPFIK